MCIHFWCKRSIKHIFYNKMERACHKKNSKIQSMKIDSSKFQWIRTEFIGSYKITIKWQLPKKLCESQLFTVEIILIKHSQMLSHWFSLSPFYRTSHIFMTWSRNSILFFFSICNYRPAGLDRISAGLNWCGIIFTNLVWKGLLISNWSLS